MFFIGTAGYSYEDWKGVFYPEDLDKKEYLGYYAKEFKFTEVNSTYYKMPNRFMLYHMQKKTPDDFQFVIKAHRGMTHKREDNEKLFDEFKESLEPLVEVNKLGCVLAQFPTSFRNRDENRDYLRDFRERMGDIPVAIEFRHEEWMDDRIFELLEEEGLGYVCVDEPQFKTLVPPQVWATSKIGYVRFHGRNYKKWWHHEKAYERYDYLYTEQELEDWVPHIQKLLAKTEKTFVSMNNHYRAQAVINGRMLQKMIEKEAVLT